MKKIKIIAIGAALASVSVLGLAHTSAGRSPPHAFEPMIPYTGPGPLIGGLRSRNWSGYAVTGAEHSVSANWTVPAVHGRGILKVSSSWVGIDGYHSNTVEQTGTESEIRSGRPVYYAWVELFPAPEQFIVYAASGAPVPVHPGDHMSGSVRARGDRYTLRLTDHTERWRYAATLTDPSGSNASAEVITEAPSVGGVIRPLANFGRMHFTSVRISGHASRVIMVNSHGRAKDEVSGSQRHFTVTWRHSS